MRYPADAKTNDVLLAAEVLLAKHGEYEAARGVRQCRSERMREAGFVPEPVSDPPTPAAWYPTEPEGRSRDGTNTWVTIGQVERSARAYLTEWREEVLA